MRFYKIPTPMVFCRKNINLIIFTGFLLTHITFNFYIYLPNYMTLRIFTKNVFVNLDTLNIIILGIYFGKQLLNYIVYVSSNNNSIQTNAKLKNTILY